LATVFSGPGALPSTAAPPVASSRSRIAGKTDPLRPSLYSSAGRTGRPSTSSGTRFSIVPTSAIARTESRIAAGRLAQAETAAFHQSSGSCSCPPSGVARVG